MCGCYATQKVKAAQNKSFTDILRVTVDCVYVVAHYNHKGTLAFFQSMFVQLLGNVELALVVSAETTI